MKMDKEFEIKQIELRIAKLSINPVNRPLINKLERRLRKLKEQE